VDGGDVRSHPDGSGRATARRASGGFAWQPDRSSGGSDLAIGAKVAIVDERRLRPALAVIGALSVPAGSDRSSSGGYDPFFKLRWGKSLPKRFDAAGNVVVQLDTAGPETFVERAVSLSVEHKVFGGLRRFWEVYRLSGTGIADTGLSKVLGKNVEVDFAVGHTLAAPASSWFATVGLAVRSPWRALFR
jgi:hypothetical protein